jgi:hypothetical protein
MQRALSTCVCMHVNLMLVLAKGSMHTKGSMHRSNFDRQRSAVNNDTVHYHDSCNESKMRRYITVTNVEVCMLYSCLFASG